ncbi:MAG: hypothetical protein II855_08700, partial [Candidatus Methanomethylophilaceae archaeon]|nr:hypothetical protein [Candidatus Methanomethylophilaceae archaeon]
MQSKKLLTIALALTFVATFAFAFAFTAEGSDAADIEKSKEADWSKFTDTSKGHFYVYLDNNSANDMVVKVTVYDGKSGDELDNIVAIIGIVFGLVQVVGGVISVINVWSYSRRAGRKGWGLLMALS